MPFSLYTAAPSPRSTAMADVGTRVRYTNHHNATKPPESLPQRQGPGGLDDSS
jgi:hypothetical protein